MLSLSKRSLGAILITAFLVYGKGGSVLANTLLPFMKNAENKSQCTNIGPVDDYSCCEFNGEYINKKYLPIYNLLNYPNEKISDLTSSGYIAKGMEKCDYTFEPVIENGVCTHKSVPVENKSQTLDSPDN